jgi:hypothetical protein
MGQTVYCHHSASSQQPLAGHKRRQPRSGRSKPVFNSENSVNSVKKWPFSAAPRLVAVATSAITLLGCRLVHSRAQAVCVRSFRSLLACDPAAA